jgi:hypothetical protein
VQHAKQPSLAWTMLSQDSTHFLFESRQMALEDRLKRSQYLLTPAYVAQPTSQA